MEKSKIEWCDSSWSPVTGCLHECPYCYARGIANRFGGWSTSGVKTTHNPFDDLPELDKPLLLELKSGKIIKAPYPFGFEPTFHRYRLGEYERKKGRTIFVCSMADLVGSWVPDRWIEEVFAACEKAPWHRYLFLTKNPQRYLDLALAGKLPSADNFWYGSTATSDDMPIFTSRDHNCFVSIEPLLSEFQHGGGAAALKDVNWLVLGAMTGPGSHKFQPKAEWVRSIVEEAHSAGVPVFMKESLVPVVGEERMLRELPWNHG